jgi:2-phospho-L-lactate guanylyltransferase
VKADLRHVVVIVPVRDLESAKSRLGETLDPEERRALVTVMLDRTVRAGIEAGFEVLVVSPSEDALTIAEAAGGEPLRQHGDGLNEALELATVTAAASGATALLVVPVDLPAIDADALRVVVANGHAAIDPGRPLVALVPDRHGTGTNALLVSPPGAIGYAFGPDSRLRHADAAGRAGAVLLELGGQLGLDLDTADDLSLAEPLLLDRPDDE